MPVQRENPLTRCEFSQKILLFHCSSKRNRTDFLWNAEAGGAARRPCIFKKMGKSSSTRPSIMRLVFPTVKSHIQWTLYKGSGADCIWHKFADISRFVLGMFALQLERQLSYECNRLQGKRPLQWALRLSYCRGLMRPGCEYLDESAWGEKRSLLHRYGCGPRLNKTSYLRERKKELFSKEIHDITPLQSIPSLRPTGGRCCRSKGVWVVNPCYSFSVHFCLDLNWITC